MESARYRRGARLDGGRENDDLGIFRHIKKRVLIT